MVISTIVFVIAVGALAGATLWVFWNNIREFLETVVRDIVEKTFGKVRGDKFADLVIWLDNTVVHAKQISKHTVESSYKWFRQNFLKMNTEYKDIRTKKPVKVTTVLVALPSGVGQETSIEEPARWEDMPDDVRAKCIKEKATMATVDELEVIDRKYRERLEMAH